MKNFFVISVYFGDNVKGKEPLESIVLTNSDRVGVMVRYLTDQYSGCKNLHIKVSFEYDNLPF